MIILKSYIGNYEGGNDVLKTYFTNKELENKCIEKYLPAISNYTKFSYDMLDDEDFVVFDADDFRQGVCQLFAYELNKKYGYPVFVISNTKNFHVFCKSKDNRYYIDVRGITDNFKQFILSLEDSYDEIDNSKLYEFAEDDFNDKYVEVYKAFARILMQVDDECYRITQM